MPNFKTRLERIVGAFEKQRVVGVVVVVVPARIIVFEE